jgi:hypothetical protein
MTVPRRGGRCWRRQRNRRAAPLEIRHRVTTDCSSATANVDPVAVVRGFKVPAVPFVPVHVTVQVIVYVAVSSPFGDPYVEFRYM